jgi:signal transduction histidine kinase
LLPVLAGLALLLGLATGVAWFVLRDADVADRLRQALLRLDALAAVPALLQAAEAEGSRALLIGDGRDLAAPRAALGSALSRYDSLVAADPVLRPTAAVLRDAVAARLRSLDDLLSRAAAADNMPPRAASDDGVRDLLRDAAGADQTRRVRDAFETLRAEEEARLLFAASRADRGVQALLGGSAIILVSLGIGGLVAARDAFRRARLAEADRDAAVAARERLMGEMTERERLEDRLRQSQKMESVGQLTGGIAHDFNNMLAVVVGNLHLLRRRAARGETDLDRFVTGALDGAQRAANLTHRLLAFARLQPLAPKPVDANRLLAGMADLLRRTLGEAIRVDIARTPGLWETHADPSQLENAILNLAVNARDAMPNGGALSVTAANVSVTDSDAPWHGGAEPGDYVLIAVTDTGTGMPEEVAARAFDPFFTTKELGRGTGLGLSQVHGFAHQSGGHVTIHSELGSGTTIRLFLPRFAATGDEPPPDLAPADTAPRPGRAEETVLVVEDEDRVRQFVVSALRELGYTAIGANGPGQALKLLDGNPGVRLLLTDVVMPEMNGRRLAEEARRRRPGLRVLFASGYAPADVMQADLPGPGAAILAKPFSLDALAQKVREALDGAAS